MTKKTPQTPRTTPSRPGSIFIGIDDTDILFKRRTFSEAQDKALELLESGMNDQITILEVRRATHVYLPDPKLESEDFDLLDLLTDEDDE